MKGKNKCKILKQIRKEIADQNEIAYAVTECKFQGDCSGTCPKCEAEVRYLEEELSKRRKAGKAVAVAGVAAALMVGSVGCTVPDTNNLAQSAPSSVETTEHATEETEQWDGELELIGEVPYEATEETEDLVLMGDVPNPEEQWTP